MNPKITELLSNFQTSSQLQENQQENNQQNKNKREIHHQKLAAMRADSPDIYHSWRPPHGDNAGPEIVSHF
jgi:hypothetical protein